MQILAIFFIAIGIWFFVSPKSALRFKSKQAKLVGVKITTSNKTVTYYKFTGLALIVLGLTMFFVR